jgi:hypothetical protein
MAQASSIRFRSSIINPKQDGLGLGLGIEEPREKSGFGVSSNAVAKCLQARPVGTTPIVARHEVPGKASRQRTVP